MKSFITVVSYLVAFVLGAVAFAAGIDGFFDLGYRGTVAGGLGYLFVCVSFFVILVLHELGHTFCGYLTGYQMVALGMGSLLLVKRDGHFSWKRHVSYSGVAAQYVGVKKDELDQRILLMFSGGLLVHFFLMLLALCFGFLSGFWSFAIAWGAINLGLFVLNSLPFGITDGAKLWELYRYPQHIPYVYCSLRQTAQVIQAADAAELRDFMMSAPLEKGGLIQSHRLNHAELQIFSGQLEEAKASLLELLDFTENTVIAGMAATSLLQIALLQRDEEAAARYGKRSDVVAVLRQKMTNCQTINALYQLRVKKDLKATRKAITIAQKTKDTSYLLRDEKEYYHTLLAQIEVEYQEMVKR